jgi:hypothetical protein
MGQSEIQARHNDEEKSKINGIKEHVRTRRSNQTCLATTAKLQAEPTAPA